MSVRVLAAVWDHSRSRGTDRLVLLAIADNCNHDGEDAWPKVATIARKAGVSERTVQRSIAALVELGELAVEGNAGGNGRTPANHRPNAYRVLVGRQSVTPTGDNVSPLRGDNLSPPIEEPSEGQPSEEPPKALTAPSPHGDTPAGPPFETFWETWPRRNGKRLGRDKAERAWARLTVPERVAAVAGARHYADASNNGLAGAKDAFRWLAAREWPDWQTPAIPGPGLRSGTPSTATTALAMIRDRQARGLE